MPAPLHLFVLCKTYSQGSTIGVTAEPGGAR